MQTHAYATHFMSTELSGISERLPEDSLSK